MQRLASWVNYERSFTGEAFKIIRSETIECESIFEEINYNLNLMAISWVY